MRILEVGLGDRSYPIWIGEGLIAEAGERLAGVLPSRRVLIVSNPTVAAYYLDPLKQALAKAGFDASEVLLPDGEHYKTIDVWQQIFDALLAGRYGRDAGIIALGGGVIGDMAGFAAACYQRGIHFIQVPTTLLAQVDSSVGGKTGVNHPAGKNMIGAFHQPRAVLIDVNTLGTLPDREFSAGLAEVIKYGLIADAAFLEWLEAHIDALMARERDVLIEAIARSCENKARIVGLDEHEQGIRAILNLGHTFGHAIETSQGYGQWLHGEAVAAGMMLAVRMSVQQGWLDQAEVPRLARLLARAGLPADPPEEMSADDFLEHMAVDKKVLNGKIRLVLLRSIGEAVITADITPAQIRAFLEA